MHRAKPTLNPPNMKLNQHFIGLLPDAELIPAGLVKYSDGEFSRQSLHEERRDG